MASDNSKTIDPHKTIIVCKVNGKEVGRISAASKKASAYMQGLAIQYGELQIDYEEDTTGGLLANLI